MLDSRAAGLGDHVARGLRRRDVAVPDDRDGAHGPPRPSVSRRGVDRAREALRPRAAVDEDGRNACVLEGPREVRRRDVLVVPAEAHLRRHRDSYRGHHPPHELSGLAELRHHRRASTDLRHLLDWAAHVDVDGLGSPWPRTSRPRRASLPGTLPKSWIREGAVLGAGFDELQGRAGLRSIRSARFQGPVVAQPKAADLAQRHPHRQVCVAGQRGEAEVRGRSQSRRCAFLPRTWLRRDSSATGKCPRYRARRAAFMRARPSASVDLGQPKLMRT